MEYFIFPLIYLIGINAAGFFLMLIDKKKAVHHKRRISERTLLCVAIIGGSLGSLIGMHVFHHKTRKKKFSLGVPACLLVHIYAVMYMIYQLM